MLPFLIVLRIQAAPCAHSICTCFSPQQIVCLHCCNSRTCISSSDQWLANECGLVTQHLCIVLVLPVHFAMGILRPQRPELMKRSPLLLSVPIGGTDTVMGLRPMAYGQDSGVTRDEARIAKKVRASPPPPHARSFYKRYKGPYLEHLSRDAWKTPPKSWRHFFYGQTSEAVYNVPENSEHMQERIEENLVTYLVSCVTERQLHTSKQILLS